MQFHKICSTAVRLFFLTAIMTFAVSDVFSQSAQGKETPSESSAIQPAAEENKIEDVAQIEDFEYISPVSIKNFIKKLNELGAKKYRIKDYTQIPSVSRGSGTDGLTVSLAGVVKLDETRYEYKIIEVEATADLTEALNRESKEGFNLRKIISYTSVEAYGALSLEIATPLKDYFTAPQLHNLILLERETDRKIVPREFRFLKADAGIGKKPTEEMKTMLGEAVKENFYPVGIYLSKGRPLKVRKMSLSGIEVYYGAIVEKFDDKPATEFEFVRAYFLETFRKRVNKLASAGYAMGGNNVSVGLMFKEPEDAPPVPKSYQWLRPESKKFAADLSKLSDAGARLYGTDLNLLEFYSDTLVENELIFEQPTGAKDFYDYLILPMVDDKPQPVLIGKIATAADDIMKKFRRAAKQGYSFANLIYADENVIAVFERRRQTAN